MAIEEKKYLDLDGLESYTKKILELLKDKADVSVVETETNRAETAEKELSQSLDWGTLGQ